MRRTFCAAGAAALSCRELTYDRSLLFFLDFNGLFEASI